MLPPLFDDWFRRRFWRPYPHQLEMAAAARRGDSTLLVAPTGAGKTLSGFLPSLVEIAAALEAGETLGLHTLYLSPLKALAIDVHRNLEQPIAELGLAIRAETRTGDTPAAKRDRQRRKPPHLLMTTPESLALLLAHRDGAALFKSVRTVVVDELHAAAAGKRGDLLALGLARLSGLAPGCRRVGLSATVADEGALVGWLGGGLPRPPTIIRGTAGPQPEVTILSPEARTPWMGHMALHALPEVYNAIRAAGTTIVFVNTRAQAELVFQDLWRLNDENLAIALHHGSLAPEQRRKVEAAMAKGSLKAVVATSSLDLGIDWGAVDLVIQIGAPKGATRLLQRLGRSNHRLDAPSRALLVPANRFEVLECRAALEAVAAGELDGEPSAQGALDVLAQHILGTACAAPFAADDLYAEVRATAPYAALSRERFDEVLRFVATGGYALGNYERYRRLTQDRDGRWRVASMLAARQYRLNVGTIVEEPMLAVKLKRGQRLGQVEEYFAQGLVAGDTFLFAGRLLRFEGIRETTVECTPASGEVPKVPVYAGGRLPLTTHLATRVRAMLADPRRWAELPGEVRDWLSMQRRCSFLPRPDQLLVETFPRGRKHYLVLYCFEGRNAHQTLGMLLTRRMERAGLHPLGFVATDYVIAVWSLKPPTDIEALLDEDMLGEDLEDWLSESSMLKRCFRNVGVIAGLIDRRHPGEEKTGRQMTVSSDLLYDVLRRHEPDHLLLQAARAEAATGLADVRRLGRMLARIRNRIVWRRLKRVSPLAVPVLLEVGRETIQGQAIGVLIEEEARRLVEEAWPRGSDGDDDDQPLLPLGLDEGPPPR